MPRPKKTRRVGFIPGVSRFRPLAVPLKNLPESKLTMDEVEALRLKDLLSFTQQEAASRMKVSRVTFQRILTSARKKVSDALINTKLIRMEGGDFRMIKEPQRKFKCEDCGYEWGAPFGTGKRGIEMECPKCKSRIIHRIDIGGHGAGRQPWGYKDRGKC